MFLLSFSQTTVKDFAARSIGILQEAMRWAPSATRSHLMQYLLQMDHSSRGLYQHSGLALITESVLQHAGYNRSAAALGVIMHKYILLLKSKYMYNRSISSNTYQVYTDNAP